MDWEDYMRRNEDEHFMKFLDRMREDSVNRLFETTVESFDEVPDLADVPLPDTAHPSLEKYADFVRQKNLPAVKIMRPLPISHFQTEEIKPTREISTHTFIMSRTWATGPMPFVGDPACYEWPIWTDDFGRTIVGSVEIRVAPELRLTYHYGTPPS